MSTIEKLFVEIFDQRRQIFEQLHRRKHIYTQHLAYKLLTHGVAPPPWLFNSDSFASSSSAVLGHKDLKKEELIGGLLHSRLRLTASYYNATAGYIDNGNPGVLTQCDFRDTEGTRNCAAETPQSRILSDNCPQLDQSLTRLKRSRSRQKAFELRNSAKVSAKRLLEDNHASGLKRNDKLIEGRGSAVCGNLNSSFEESPLVNQDIPSEEEEFSCLIKKPRDFPKLSFPDGDSPTLVLKPKGPLQTEQNGYAQREILVEDVADISSSAPTSCHQEVPLGEGNDLDCLGLSPAEDRDSVGRKGNNPYPESSTSERKLNSTENVFLEEVFDFTDQLPHDTMERARFMEQLCRSACEGVPLSQFYASYSSHSVCQSVPDGILEHVDVRSSSSLNMNASELQDFSYASADVLLNRNFERKQYSDYLPFHRTKRALDLKGPCSPPVSRAIEGYASRTCNSGKLNRSITKLTFLPIEEGSEQDEDADILGHTSEQGIISATESISGISEDNMEYLPLDPASERNDSESLSTVTQLSGSNKQGIFSPNLTGFSVNESDEQDANATDMTHTCPKKNCSAVQGLREISQKHMNSSALDHAADCRSSGSESRESFEAKSNPKDSRESHSERGILKQEKENHNISLGTSCIKKHSKTHNTRSSKRNLSAQCSLGTRVESFPERELRPRNIISNVKSFLPCVQQRQAVACKPGKKEARVRAIKAAKKLAEKKENDHKHKKAMLKLERDRMKQESLRLWELAKKAKKKEQKSVDDEILERKRKKDEEEERNGRERKTKRAREAQKQRVQNEKMPGGSRNPAKSKAKDLGMSSNSCNFEEDADTDMIGCSTPKADKDFSLVSDTIQEGSYEISPYQCSDEETEEDDLPDKFVPTWARKSSITLALSSLHNLDPVVIFPPGSFCSLNEVLPRRRIQR